MITITIRDRPDFGCGGSGGGVDGEGSSDGGGVIVGGVVGLGGVTGDAGRVDGADVGWLSTIVLLYIMHLAK